MKDTLPITFIIILIISYTTGYCQSNEKFLIPETLDSTINYKNTSIGLNIDLGSSFFHNSPITLSNCENCSHENQRPKLVLRPEFLLSYRANKNHEIHFGFGITQFGFIEDIIISDRELLGRSKHFDFYSIALGHGLIFKENDQLQLSLKNQIITDIYFESHLWLIRRENFSFRSSLLLTWKVSKKISLQLTPFIKQSIRAYNRITFDKNYWPYTIGIGAGLKYSFKHVKNKKEITLDKK